MADGTKGLISKTHSRGIRRRNMADLQADMESAATRAQVALAKGKRSRSAMYRRVINALISVHCGFGLSIETGQRKNCSFLGFFFSAVDDVGLVSVAAAVSARHPEQFALVDGPFTIRRHALSQFHHR